MVIVSELDIHVHISTLVAWYLVFYLKTTRSNIFIISRTLNPKHIYGRLSE